MNDNLPPLPPYAPEFKPRWATDPGGYNEDQMKAYARAAIERQSVPALWAIHVPGPDDLYPAPSYEAAKHMAAKHNTAMTEYYKANPDTSGYRPPIESALATATAWTGNAADHAEEIAAFDYAAWWLAAPQPQQVQQDQCPECDGTGTVAGSQAHFPCPLCTSPQAQPTQPLTETQADALNALCKMLHSGEEVEGDDGLAMLVPMDLWNEAQEAAELLIGEDVGTESAHSITKGTT